MPVTDEQVAWLRGHLAGDLDEVHRVNEQATSPGVVAGIGALTNAAFAIAARRKFAPGWTGADLTGFVEQVRRQPGGQGEALDPGAAEQELRSMLGEKAAGQSDVRSRGRAQFILLSALVQSLRLTQAEVTDLLNDARDIADRLLPGGH